MSSKNNDEIKRDNITEKSVTLSDLDPDFRREVMAHEDASQLNHCFACGSCTAGCPVHEVFPEFDPRKLALKVKLGMRAEVLSSPSIWYCTACYNCEQHCPQNVRFCHILNVLKNMATREGHAPYPLILQTKNVGKTGLVFRADSSWMEKRRSLSLPDLKLDGEKAGKIIEISGLDKIVVKRGRR